MFLPPFNGLPVEVVVERGGYPSNDAISVLYLLLGGEGTIITLLYASLRMRLLEKKEVVSPLEKLLFLLLVIATFRISLPRYYISIGIGSKPARFPRVLSIPRI